MQIYTNDCQWKNFVYTNGKLQHWLKICFVYGVPACIQSINRYHVQFTRLNFVETFQLLLKTFKQHKPLRFNFICKIMAQNTNTFNNHILHAAFIYRNRRFNFISENDRDCSHTLNVYNKRNEYLSNNKYENSIYYYTLYKYY